GARLAVLRADVRAGEQERVAGHRRPAPAVLLVRRVPREPLLGGRVLRRRVPLVPRSVQPPARTCWLGIEVDGPTPRASVQQGRRLPFRSDIRFPPAGELAPRGRLP